MTPGPTHTTSTRSCVEPTPRQAAALYVLDGALLARRRGQSAVVAILAGVVVSLCAEEVVPAAA